MIPNNLKYIFLFVSIAVSSCATNYEVVHPFKNLGYSGDRLMPVKTNYSEFTFRIWISNSTSIDRIISVYKDSLDEYHANMIEFGKVFHGKKHRSYYNEINITPGSGFARFKQKLDEMEIQKIPNQTDPIGYVEHEPFSTYVVEVKEKGLFNTFRFDTNYPKTSQLQSKYTQLERLIFDEFDLIKYYKFKPQG